MDILQRLRTATEGSEELDVEVVALLNQAIVKRYPPTDDFGPRNRWQFWSLDGAHFLGNEGTRQFAIRRYTRSVDEALTLVPREWRLYALQEEYIYPPNLWFAGLDRRREHTESMIGKAATPALALTIAALLARSSELLRATR